MEHLIPTEWFTPLAQPMLLGIMAIAIGALIKGADWLIDGASGVAYRMSIPKVVVGATIVSLGTTSPECAVSVMAAWAGESGLALGNAVGSIIADTGLIFGLGCLLAALPADRFVLQRQGRLQLAAGILLAGVCYFAFVMHTDDAVIGRWVGAAMLGLLAVYLGVSIHWSKQHPFGEPSQVPEGVAEAVPFTPEAEGEKKVHPVWLLGVMILVGLAVVILSSRVLVCSVTVLAERWGVPQVVIAATIVAFGTSLPELVVGIASIAKGHSELLVGNIIGADILNVLFVIGASAVAADLPIVDNGSRIFLYLHLPAMLMILLLFRAFTLLAMRTGRYSRWQGGPLLLAYVGYLAAQFLVSRGG